MHWENQNQALSHVCWIILTYYAGHYWLRCNGCRKIWTCYASSGRLPAWERGFVFIPWAAHLNGEVAGL